MRAPQAYLSNLKPFEEGRTKVCESGEGDVCLDGRRYTCGIPVVHRAYLCNLELLEEGGPELGEPGEGEVCLDGGGVPRDRPLVHSVHAHHEAVRRWLRTYVGTYTREEKKKEGATEGAHSAVHDTVPSAHVLDSCTPQSGPSLAPGLCENLHKGEYNKA